MYDRWMVVSGYSSTNKTDRHNIIEKLLKLLNTLTLTLVIGTDCTKGQTMIIYTVTKYLFWHNIYSKENNIITDQLMTTLTPLINGFELR
jgi:hypothetical protein